MHDATLYDEHNVDWTSFSRLHAPVYCAQMHAFIHILVTTVRPGMCVVSIALRQVMYHGLVCSFYSAVSTVVVEAAREVTPPPTALLLVLPLALKAKA